VRIVGEAPHSAAALGYPVIRIRYLATLFGGAMAGLGGAYLSLAYTPIWVEDMTAGRGWIALALVVFADPGARWRLVLGAWLFGGVLGSAIVRSGGLVPHCPSEVLSALPYVATIVVLVVISRNPQTLRLNTPLSLAQPFQARTFESANGACMLSPPSCERAFSRARCSTRPCAGSWRSSPRRSSWSAGDGVIKAIHRRETAEADGEARRFATRAANSSRWAPTSIFCPAWSTSTCTPPQWPQLGKALDLPLEQWLQAYTFPLESRYADPALCTGPSTSR